MIVIFRGLVLLGQENRVNSSGNVLDHIIAKRANAGGEIEIIEKPVAKIIDYHLAKIIHTKDRVFVNNDEGKKASIKLTEKERDSIISALRRELKLFWKPNDFHYPLAGTNKDGYLIHKRITRLLLTHPIFLRNNEITVVLFGTYNTNTTYGHSDLAIYKKMKDVWTMWIPISSRTDGEK
ncbi:hypothetical protein [Flavobacterium suncheonense]|uniref:hypothetical protein n=1 Tax=Flavobacterium suncheonense TaxID=350894 RepID=UPI00103A63B0|nr:hypothetical protein [Flavobacterium suncheonense]